MARDEGRKVSLGVEPTKTPKKYPRLAVYAGPVTDRLLSQAKAGGANVSGRLEQICRRFEYFRAAMLRDERLQFTPAEWVLFVQALQEGAGHMEYEAWKHVLYFAQAVAGQFEAMYGINPTEIASRLRDAGDAVNIAVADTVEQYWSLSPTSGHVEKLHMLGLVEKEEIKKWAAGAKQRDRAYAAYQAEVHGVERREPDAEPDAE
jgi:hypothetical protein